jgi:hypothetical protein
VAVRGIPTAGGGILNDKGVPTRRGSREGAACSHDLIRIAVVPSAVIAGVLAGGVGEGISRDRDSGVSW